MTAKIRWAARVENVREVSLRGAANLEFWTRTLEPQGLVPVSPNGVAEALVIAADAKFLGIGFREISFSILCRPLDAALEGAFLVQAFNSNAPFAWFERAIFSTPYLHAGVHIESQLPASIELIAQGKPAFRMAMAHVPSTGPATALHGPDCWQGPVYLPVSRSGGKQVPRAFFARLSGATNCFPFASSDSWSMEPGENTGGLALLAKSGFQPLQWLVRTSARHEKSKTYRRAELAAMTESGI